MFGSGHEASSTAFLAVEASFSLASHSACRFAKLVSKCKILESASAFKASFSRRDATNIACARSASCKEHESQLAKDIEESSNSQAYAIGQPKASFQNLQISCGPEV
jgi:hypothetical protein